MKIGMACLKGSLPGFETFGNLPTDVVKSNGLVNGVPAHKEIDALIIPGGSIVESEAMTTELAIEIKKMVLEGKFILGICSGFQVLANQTDVGRKSHYPIVKKGLGILDASFSPMINNDRVEATVVNDSFFTSGIKEKITGFHCHTYGDIESNEKEIFRSDLKRTNYMDDNDSYLSGVINDEENVVGTMIHGILDNNPKIVENIFNFLDVQEEDAENIFKSNKLFKTVINKNLGNSEIAIEKNSELKNKFYNKYPYLKNDLKSNLKNAEKNNVPPTLFIGSTSSDSGKTFITTGIAGAFRKRGLKVAILKIGPDIRDTLPGLYLTNGLMEDFASIKIGHLGWKDIEYVLKDLKGSEYDLVLIEGAMSVLIGILKDQTPFSGAEIALSSDIPLLLVSSVNKSGIESEAISISNQIDFLKDIGIKVNGAILNRVYDFDLFEKVLPFMKKKSNLEDIMAIGKVKLDERGGTPEIEINLEDFGLTALNAVEKYLDLNKIIEMAGKPKFKGFISKNKINSFFDNG